MILMTAQIERDILSAQVIDTDAFVVASGDNALRRRVFEVEARDLVVMTGKDREKASGVWTVKSNLK